MIKLSDKFKAFVSLLDIEEQHIYTEVLEGQTSAGKTTIGIGLKFILLVALSKKKLHLLCGYTMGKLESSIIVKENGILDIASQLGYKVEYKPNGYGEIRLAHIIVYGKTREEDRIIYCAGYSDTTKWKDILGNQYGIVAVDEANIANIDFLRELSMRRDYWMMTLNPDDPNMPIYSEFINHARPLKEYEKDYPSELLNQLYSGQAKEGYIHWYFTMNDNAALSEEKKQQIIDSVPPNSKQYKNKILGLRGRSEGLVFEEFTDEKIIPFENFRYLPNEMVSRVICGLDSGLNNDATALVTMLITTAGRLLVIPSFYYLPKVGSNANSIQAQNIAKWLDYWLPVFGINITNIVQIIGDSAAITQDLIYEINLNTPFTAAPVEKKDILKDTQRVKSIIGKDDYFYIIDAGYRNPLNPNEVLGQTDMFIVELNNKVWDVKKNLPEDGNDHCIDAFKYGSYYIYYLYGGV